jgi:hypothetical protein
MYSPQSSEQPVAIGPMPVQAPPVRTAAGTRAPVALGFRVDERLGWAVALLLYAAYVVYFARLSSFPFQDYPNHLARGVALADLLFHHGQRFGQVFEFHFMLVPYLLHDLLLAGCIELLGLTAGATVFSTLVLLSLPLALLFYMRANNLAPRAQLLVFLLSLYLSTDWFFLMAFMAFRLAVAMILVSMAMADLLRQRWSGGLYAGYIGVLVVGYLIHLTSIVFFAPVLVISALVRLWFSTTTMRRELALLAPVLVLMALHFGLLVEPYSATNPPAYAFVWGSPIGKLKALTFEFERFDGRPSKPMMLMLAVCLLWPIRRAISRASLTKPRVIENLAVAAAFLAVFIMLPSEYADSSFVDVRALPMALLFLMFACLNLPDAALEGRTFNTAPVLALAALLAIGNLAYLALHMSPNNTYVADYRAVAAYLPPNSRVLAVHTRRKQMDIAPFLHIGSFAVIDRTAIIPYLFSGDRGDPMKFFRYRYKPYMPDESWYIARKVWNKSTDRTFEVNGREYRWKFDEVPGQWYWHMIDIVPIDWNRVACDYDYLLFTMPFDMNLVGVATRPVAMNNSAALLAVDKTACHREAERPRSPVRLPGER